MLLAGRNLVSHPPALRTKLALQPSARFQSLHCRAAQSKALQLLSAQQQEQVDGFLDFLFEFNTHTNLTAVRNKEEAVYRHVQDSLALLPVIEQHTRGKEELHIIDVGSGAGLPGVLLAIARPQWQVVTLDATRKRCDFVTEAAGRVGLSNVTPHWGRAEDAGRGTLREVNDVAVARAVAELRVLAELCLPLVKVQGMWIAAKSAGPEEEVKAAAVAIATLGGELVRIEDVDSVGPEGPRTAVVVQKTTSTPSKYPRRPGTPNKHPL